MSRKGGVKFEDLDSDDETGNENVNSNATFEDPQGNRRTQNQRRGNREQNRRDDGRNGRRRQGGGIFDDFFGDTGFGGGFGGGGMMDNFFGGSMFGGGRRRGFGGFGDSSDEEDIFSGIRNFGSGGNGNTQFFSSSTSSTTINGVTQKTHHSKDSSGREKMSISRKIGDKSCKIEKNRYSDGNETTSRRLNNLEESELDDFDRSFRQFNGRRLTDGRGNSTRERPRMIEDGRSHHSQRRRNNPNERDRRRKKTDKKSKKKSGFNYDFDF